MKRLQMNMPTLFLQVRALENICITNRAIILFNFSTQGSPMHKQDSGLRNFCLISMTY